MVYLKRTTVIINQINIGTVSKASFQKLQIKPTLKLLFKGNSGETAERWTAVHNGLFKLHQHHFQLSWTVTIRAIFKPRTAIVLPEVSMHHCDFLVLGQMLRDPFHEAFHRWDFSRLAGLVLLRPTFEVSLQKLTWKHKLLSTDSLHTYHDCTTILFLFCFQGTVTE